MSSSAPACASLAHALERVCKPLFAHACADQDEPSINAEATRTQDDNRPIPKKGWGSKSHKYSGLGDRYPSANPFPPEVSACLVIHAPCASEYSQFVFHLLSSSNILWRQTSNKLPPTVPTVLTVNVTESTGSTR